MELLRVTIIHLNVKKQAKFPLGNQFGPTWAQFCSHSVPLFIYWSLTSLSY
ncbi:hypothetical protein T09_15460 [Trichinella sp. T9]|nr:hypothetical protein T09_15460 [Trichinella sp. T9]